MSWKHPAHNLLSVPLWGWDLSSEATETQLDGRESCPGRDVI